MAVNIYKGLVRPLLFSGLKTDPEWLHRTTLQWLAALNERRDTAAMVLLRQQIQRRCSYVDHRLNQTCFGLQFPNPVGLAAGFDKDGAAAGLWSDFGFGFAEMGTVTWHAQAGNPQPRLFRLIEDEAVLNRMGFNNSGAQALAERLRQVNATAVSSTVAAPLGINLGKSKITPLEQAAEDYCASFEVLRDLGDYFVVNVSSPNTPGLRQLQAAEQLAPILAGLQALNLQQRPILLKIAPDLSEADIAAIADVAIAQNLAGIIATNTTIERSNLKTQRLAATGNPVVDEAGGLSGAPLRQRSTEVIRFLYRETQGKLPIIGVGGVASAADAWEKITAGASLVQLYSGWVYEGPEMMRHLLEGLTEHLDRTGLNSIADAVGVANGNG